MIHAPAEIIVQLLVNKALATKPSSLQPWPVFYGVMPTDPDNVLTVYDTLGIKDGRLQESGEVVIHPGIQIRIRNNTYNLGWRKGYDITNAFDTVRNENVVLGTGVNQRTYKIHAIKRPSGVLPLGQELGKTRLLFTVNCTITISDVTP